MEEFEPFPSSDHLLPFTSAGWRSDGHRTQAPADEPMTAEDCHVHYGGAQLPSGDHLLGTISHVCSLPTDVYHGLVRGGFDEQLLERLAQAEHDEDAWRRAFRDAGDGTDSPNMVAIRQLRTLIWLQTERIIAGALDQLSEIATEVITLRGMAQGALREGNSRLDVKVENKDILQVSQELKLAGFNVAVLNMANAAFPGGGFRSGAGAQEENLHRRSDMQRFLEGHPMRLYPIRTDSCLLSRGVTVFRGTEAHGYPFLDQTFPVSIISSAAVHHPRLTRDREYALPRDEKDMWLQIRLIVEAARLAGCDALALSAFGCGAFGNPPEQVAAMFREVLSANSDAIRCVVFCILNDHNSGHWHNPRGNFAPFADAFKDFSSAR